MMRLGDYNLKDQTYIKFIMGLKCPVCKSQLDGNLNVKRPDLYCRADPEEYFCSYSNYEIDPRTESMRHTYSSKEYIMDVSSTFLNDKSYLVTIYSVELDLNITHRFKNKKIILKYTGERFLPFYEKVSEKELLEKIYFYGTFL